MGFWQWYLTPIKGSLTGFLRAFLSFRWLLEPGFEVTIGCAMVGIGIATAFLSLVGGIVFLLGHGESHSIWLWLLFTLPLGVTMACHGVWRDDEEKVIQ